LAVNIKGMLVGFRKPAANVYRAANELIEQHGEDAPIHAAIRSNV